MKNKEKIFNYYMLLVYGVFFPLFLIFSILYIFFIEIEEVDDIFVYFGIIGISISVFLGLMIFVYLIKYLKAQGAFLDFFKTFGASLLFLPGFLIYSIGYSNFVFDSSKPVSRDVQIIYKKNSTRVRKGRSRDSFYVDVKSWKSNLDRVTISVDQYSFENLKVGDRILIKTKSGFWDLEYIDFNQD